MIIGVISEGHADRAVISNLIIGITGLDQSDIRAIRPIYRKDETDLSKIDPKTFSSWSVVIEECKSRSSIDEFLSVEGQDFVVIHLDTAECDDYNIKRPNKNDKNYCEILRELVIGAINGWLNKDIKDQILYAVAIEETDAWLLTLYETRDTQKHAKPKETLKSILIRNKLDTTSNFENYIVLSKVFLKTNKVKKGKYLTYNSSLKSFCDEIESKVKPKIKLN